MALPLEPLGDRTYTALSAWDGEEAMAWPGAPAATLKLLQRDGEAIAVIDTGCNALTVPITLTDKSITPTRGVMMTGKYCRGARGEQERWLIGFFERPLNYGLEDRNLRLTTGSRSHLMSSSGS